MEKGSSMIKSDQKKLGFVYFWLGLIVFLFFILRFVPIFNSFKLSFFDWNLINPKKFFIGFQNYSKLFKDSKFLLSLKNTLIFAVVVVLFSILISLGLAISLKKKFFGRDFFETLYFIPYIIAVVPAALAWKFIYDPTNGALNMIVSCFGFSKQAWLINDDLALGAIIVMTVWQRIGYNLIIFSVGISEIPQDFYDAAGVDGAGSFQIFRKITLPLLLPVTIYLFIMNTIEAFNIFTPVYVMTTGTQSAPASVVSVLVMDIYQNAFRYYKMGYASAESICLFLVILIVSCIQFYYFKKKEVN